MDQDIGAARRKVGEPSNDVYVRLELGWNLWSLSINVLTKNSCTCVLLLLSKRLKERNGIDPVW